MKCVRLTAVVWLLAAGGALAADEREVKFATELDALQPVPVMEGVLREQFVALGDMAYAKRAAASQAILAMGPGTVERLQQWAKNEADPERRVRANEIIARWARMPLERAVRVRELVEMWKQLELPGQTQYAEKLVDLIGTLPAETQADKREPARGRFGQELNIPMDLVVERDALGGEVAQGLCNKSVAANQVLARFLDKPFPALVLRAMDCVGSPHADGVDVAPQLMRLATGPDKPVALRALSNLSNWSQTGAHREEIAATLKKLYDHTDGEVALQAAIISCYSGDWSGFPRLLAATKDTRRDLRLKAVAQLVDSRFRGRTAEVVPVLVAQLTTDDEELLERAIESLGAYPAAAMDILPFLQDSSPRIVRRTVLSLGAMQAKVALPELERLRDKTTDQDQLNVITQTLRSIREK